MKVAAWVGVAVFASVGTLSGAQRDGLGRLVDDGMLSAEQSMAVQAVLNRAPARRDGSPGWLVEVAAYVGGGLMLGGVTVFLAASWNELTQVARTGVLAVLALAFMAGGVLVAGGPGRVRRLATGDAAARRRIVGVLFGLAAVPAALATGVGVNRYPGLSGASVGLAVAAAGMLLLPTAAGLVVTAAMSVAAVTQLGAEVLHASPLGAGLLLIGLGLAWIVVVMLRLVPFRHLGFAVGTGLALIGAQLPAGAYSSVAWAYTLTFALALGCFLAYRFQRSVVLLVTGVVGVTLAVPEAVNDWTEGAVGGAVILLLAGAVLVAASGLGLRMRRTAT